MIKTQYINLNMVPSGVLPVLYCSQYDIGRPLGMVVYNGGEAVDLSTYTCAIEATRTDGTAITAAVTTDGNVGAFATTATMTNQADKYPAKMVIVDSAGSRVASLAFVMCITPATMDENAEGIEEDKSLYQQYTGTVQSQIAMERQQRTSADTTVQSQIAMERQQRTSADTTLQSNINAEASTRATTDASLQSQIDQLIAPSGEAPSAAEVQNARIGADGVTYSTLGDAIRGQVTDLKNHLALFADDGKVLKDFVWEQGLIAEETGLDTDDGSTTRCRTAGYYSTDCEEIVVDRSVVTYGVYLYYYDENHNFISPRSSVYLSSSITPNKDYPYFRIAVYYSGHSTSAISATDCANRIKIKKTAEIVNDINTDIAKAVGVEDAKTNILHNLINYNYDVPANLAEETGSSLSRCIGIVRNGTMVKLSGVNTAKSGDSFVNMVIRLNGIVTRSGTGTPTTNAIIDGWNKDTVTFTSGHKYRLKIKPISGSSEIEGATYLPALSVYKVGTHSSIGTLIRKDTEVIREFTPDTSAYNIVIYIYTQTVLTDFVALVTIEDCTLINGQSTTTYLNEDVETAIVPCTGFNTFISGDAASFVTGKTHFSFAAIADVHGTPDAFERYIQYANEHKKYLDAILCLGDIVQSRPSDPYDWFGDNIPNSEVPFLFTVGNHDVSYTGASAISESEARARYFPEIIENGWLEAEDFIGTDRCSWYKDFSDYSIRVISIYEYGNSQTSSSAPKAYCRRWLDSDVLQWFADTLYTTPTGYSVIVLLHQIPYAPMDFIVHPFCVTESIAFAPNHWTTMLLNTVNGNPIEDIVNAFINSSNISQTYNSIASYQLDKTAVVSKDFSARSENGKFVAYFCGHTHASYIFKSRTYPNQICIGVPSGSESAMQRSYGDMLYDSDNRNMDSFYIVGIDTSQKKINLVQIGGHVSSDMRERSFGIVSY